MKSKLTFIALLFSVNAFTQFPAPTNFTLQGKYILIGECDDCLIPHLLCGPTYCSLFSWQPPTETTTATFEHYNIYREYNNEITFITSDKGLSYWAHDAPLGNFWVTSVYSNPIGESLPSNVVAGWESLPTSNSQIQTKNENIVFSSYEQTITVNSDKTLIKMNLINSNGRIVKCIHNPSKSINIDDLPKGFYIVEVYCESSDVIRQKIIK